MSIEMDGIHRMVADDKIPPQVKKLRNTFKVTPNEGFIQKEFGFYCLDRWRTEGLPVDVDLKKFFSFDDEAEYQIRGIGWTAANFHPPFEEKILEDLGDYEDVQDVFGRVVRYFKGRRSGFMPTFMDHPVKDLYTFEKNVKWRLDPENENRNAIIDKFNIEASLAARDGYFITQRVIGGYMFLRSLIGPEDLLMAFYDQPELLHKCMETWLDLADKTIEKHQKHVTLDQVFFGEDICYNGGSLISPDMIKEFLFPYYKQLITNIRKRQIDKERPLYIQLDTDGFCDPIIDLYTEIGMNVLSPFEVASGSDVLRTGEKYPKLVMSGGIDKRVIAEGKDSIDRFVDRIYPALYKRGGFIPTCDHGVPAEVSLENYLYFRKKTLEYK